MRRKNNGNHFVKKYFAFKILLKFYNKLKYKYFRGQSIVLQPNI